MSRMSAGSKAPALTRAHFFAGSSFVIVARGTDILQGLRVAVDGKEGWGRLKGLGTAIGWGSEEVWGGEAKKFGAAAFSAELRSAEKHKRAEQASAGRAIVLGGTLGYAGLGEPRAVEGGRFGLGGLQQGWIFPKKWKPGVPEPGNTRRQLREGSEMK
ncbi:hypothetical protein GGX14DRAFT_397540 [Mycena pura]|uniref:Uncharacterized protein n=1 Tax=Mycena pura TaxID=153505 RepID=A0AAD6V8Y9_9AGAR|nr:hypothetical protein GGX14DRAFT_397540 [Mycena pura]